MSRLTKRENGELYYRQGDNYAWSKPINKGNVKYPTLSKLAHYEDLEEQGRLIELPCAVGDTVWSLDLDIHWIEYFKVTYITVTEHGIGIENPYFGYGFDVKDLGDTVFLTKEEAEAKLKEMKGEQE